MKKKLISGLAVLMSLSAVFTACSSDLDVQYPEQQGSRTIRLTSQVQGTRSIGDPQSANLAENTEVGVFGTVGTTALNSNEKYTVKASNDLDVATTDNAMTWPTDDATAVTVYAYAPYQNNWTADGSNAFSVNTDQMSNANYLASDLVWATATLAHSAATDDKIPLSFSHSLTKVNITISKAAGSNVNLEGATVYITNTVTNATVNATTGVATASTGTNQITAATISSDLEAGVASSTTTACAVIVPQTLAANTAFIKIVTTETNGSKTLIAKLGTATTFAANTPYDMSVSVGSVADNSTTEVTLLLGSTEISGWDTPATLGQKTYGVGDYVLNDGTFLKSTDDDFSTKKANAIAVIFSTKVSETDATRGFNAYAMGLATLGNKNWGSSNSWLGINISTWADALNDLDGIEKSGSILNHSTYMGLTNDAKAKVLANLSDYTLTVNDGVTNLSGWFTPSIGQMIMILNNLGEAGLSNSTGFKNSNVSSPGWGYNDSNQAQGDNLPSTEDLCKVKTNIDKFLTDVGKSALGYALYASVTESGNSSNANFWQVSFKETYGYNIGQNPGKTGSAGRNVIPCIAIKNLPIASE